MTWIRVIMSITVRSVGDTNNYFDYIKKEVITMESYNSYKK